MPVYYDCLWYQKQGLTLEIQFLWISYCFFLFSVERQDDDENDISVKVKTGIVTNECIIKKKKKKKIVFPLLFLSCPSITKVCMFNSYYILKRILHNFPCFVIVIIIIIKICISLWQFDLIIFDIEYFNKNLVCLRRVWRCNQNL